MFKLPSIIMIFFILTIMNAFVFNAPCYSQTFTVYNNRIRYLFANIISSSFNDTLDRIVCDFSTLINNHYFATITIGKNYRETTYCDGTSISQVSYTDSSNNTQYSLQNVDGLCYNSVGNDINLSGICRRAFNSSITINQLFSGDISDKYSEAIISC